MAFNAGEARDSHGRWTSSGVDVEHEPASDARTRKAMKLLTHIKTLTPEQVKQMNREANVNMTLEEHGALMAYLDNKYAQVNDPLRTGVVYATMSNGKVVKETRVGDKGARVETHRAAVSALDDAIAKLPEYRGESTRLIEAEGEKLDRVLAAYKPGARLSESAFTSATPEGGTGTIEHSNLFSGIGPNVEIRIRGVKGYHVPRELGQTAGEDEVIYPRHSHFIVDKVEKVSEGRPGSTYQRQLPAKYRITLKGE